MGPLAKQTRMQPIRLLSRLSAVYHSQDDTEEREPLIPRGFPFPPSLGHTSSTLHKVEVRNERLPISNLDDVALSQHHVKVVQELLPSLPSQYPLLDPRNITLTGEHPIAAGGFANIWGAIHAGRRVVLKSYRCYIESFDIARVAMRFLNEVRACGRLSDSDKILVGVYSTERHPLGLIYEYMVNFDLNQYLTDESNVEKLKLLMDVAQGLKRMHDLNIAHGNLNATNILVDKGGAPHIAGLGSAHILPRSKLWTVLVKTRANRLFRSSSSEPGTSSDATHLMRSNKPSDICAFGVMAFEILTGRPVFHEMSKAAANRSMSEGFRPPRPDQVSETLWQMIRSCWNPKEHRRMKIGGVVALLEEEWTRITDL
ncbi:kinase-like domain-containing protein [Thelephora terrestris]|uniref:Kinase-like domain-containing protein n=1 Tax=Thelephora terrestris TaxID=56493 RepID=A0A9P6HPB4_9AGAM|nr:kinase-like domain-containing protein [Thelephora terrestris]